MAQGSQFCGTGGRGSEVVKHKGVDNNLIITSFSGVFDVRKYTRLLHM